MLVPDLNAATRRGRRCQRGITLIESLVSMLVLAVAVLGMLGVQLRTLAETQTGVRRAQAVRLIEDLAERVKTNPDGFAQLSAFQSGWDDVPGGANCETGSCDAATLARWDIQQWKNALSAVLPNARATVFLSTDEAASNRRQLGVMVGWRANERASETRYVAPFAAGSDATRIECPVELICHLTYVQP